jgi:hypothetical protein
MNMQATIYQVLKDKLGREPTHKELCADVQRILTDVSATREYNRELALRLRNIGPNGRLPPTSR